MKKEKFIFLLGSTSYILVGIGHVITSLVAPKTTEQLKMIAAMEDFKISLAGSNSNLYLFHEGFSLMMGAFLVGYGALNVMIVRNNPELVLSKNSILTFNILMSFIAVAISVHYLFLVPVLFTSISLVSYIIVFGIKSKSTRSPAPAGD